MPELKSAGDDNIVAIEAAKIVERVVGIAWATDKYGNFIYLSEPLLSTKNLSINQLNKPVKNIIVDGNLLFILTIVRQWCRSGEMLY